MKVKMQPLHGKFAMKGSKMEHKSTDEMKKMMAMHGTMAMNEKKHNSKMKKM